jgi:hypothetical protein
VTGPSLNVRWNSEIKKKTTILIFLPIIYLVISDVYWRRHITPEPNCSLETLKKRFGKDVKTESITKGTTTFIHASGPLPPIYLFAVIPSSRPAYIFNLSGELIDWQPDPGELNEGHSFFRWFDKKSNTEQIK